MKRLVATLVLASSLAPLLAAPPAEACYKYNPFCSSSRGSRNIRTRPGKPKPTPAPAGTLSIEQVDVGTGDLSDLGVDSGNINPTKPADIGPAGTLNIPQGVLLHDGESAEQERQERREREREERRREEKEQRRWEREERRRDRRREREERERTYIEGGVRLLDSLFN